MAYAAISSLMYTLEQLFKPNQSFVCPCSTQQHVENLNQNLSALQDFLDNTTTKDIETLKVVEKRIRDVVYKAEDKVDSSLRSIILADSTESREGAFKFFEEELVKVEKDVDSIRKEVKVVDFNKHGTKSAELATTPFSPDQKSTIVENTVVGMKDDFNIILDRLIAQTDELIIIPIFGMGGIGKTTLARKVYDDSCIRSRFDKHAWVTISQEYNERQMLLEQLKLYGLRKLEEIPVSIGDIMTLKFIQIKHCSSGVENSAKSKRAWEIISFSFNYYCKGTFISNGTFRKRLNFIFIYCQLW